MKHGTDVTIFNAADIRYNIFPQVFYFYSSIQQYFSMSFFDMLGYLVMAPLLDYFGRVRTLTGAYSITGGSIIISSLITYFFPDVAFLGTVCRVLGELFSTTSGHCLK